jgi:hypothetical protein
VRSTLLKECIDTLLQLRDAKHGELDTSIIVELDEVIAQLQSCCEANSDEAEIGPLAQRALEVFGRVAESFMAEIIKAWFDSE